MARVNGQEAYSTSMGTVTDSDLKAPLPLRTGSYARIRLACSLIFSSSAMERTSSSRKSHVTDRTEPQYQLDYSATPLAVRTMKEEAEGD